mmetsp:Transcript_36219/g.77235  ORF Transcript_36219/g.77235 Transcript_36219/m.77235 type:complete len:95 (+) Transcript_36219:96-380(+)
MKLWHTFSHHHNKVHQKNARTLLCKTLLCWVSNNFFKLIIFYFYVSLNNVPTLPSKNWTMTLTRLYDRHETLELIPPTQGLTPMPPRFTHIMVP